MHLVDLVSKSVFLILICFLSQVPSDSKLSDYQTNLFQSIRPLTTLFSDIDVVLLISPSYTGLLNACLRFRSFDFWYPVHIDWNVDWWKDIIFTQGRNILNDGLLLPINAYYVISDDWSPCYNFQTEFHINPQ